MQINKTTVALGLPILALFLWVLILSAKMMFLPEVVVRIRGYDPRDLLAGHYIAYTINWDDTDCKQFKDNVCPVKEFEIHANKARWGEQHRYYIPEEYAKELDYAFRNQWKEKSVFEVIYKYTPGLAPIAKELLINGKPWKETIVKKTGENNGSSKN